MFGVGNPAGASYYHESGWTGDRTGITIERLEVN